MITVKVRDFCQLTDLNKNVENPEWMTHKFAV